MKLEKEMNFAVTNCIFYVLFIPNLDENLRTFTFLKTYHFLNRNSKYFVFFGNKYNL